jgi:peroxiredoxin Q/BCP
MSLFGKNPLEVGAEAPVLKVKIQTGETLDLAEVYAEGPTLIYFYPKSFTKGCEIQACNLRDKASDTTAAGLRVIGVSRDTVKKQAEFKEELKLPFDLVADEDGALGDAFGVGQILGVAPLHKRQSFLVVEGKVAWVDTSATPSSQTEDALAALAAAK